MIISVQKYVKLWIKQDLLIPFIYPISNFAEIELQKYHYTFTHAKMRIIPHSRPYWSMLDKMSRLVKHHNCTPFVTRLPLSLAAMNNMNSTRLVVAARTIVANDEKVKRNNFMTESMSYRARLKTQISRRS